MNHTFLRGLRRVLANPKQGVKLHARHHCHAGWDHTELLTTFVVGIQ